MKKGITPVIAIVLLLMMTVAAAGLAYEFIMSMTQDATSDIEAARKIQSDRMRTNLQILQVEDDGTDLVFTIKNTGSIDMPTFIPAEINVKYDGQVKSIAGGFGDTCESAGVAAGSTCILKLLGETGEFPQGVGTLRTFEFVLSNGYTLSYGCTNSSQTNSWC